MKRTILLVGLIPVVGGVCLAQRGKPDVDNVKVGMTYDEVKKIAGNPLSEANGFTKVQGYSVAIEGRDDVVSWMYSLFQKDTVYLITQNTRRARYQRPVHYYFINGIPVTDDEYRSIVPDSAGGVTFRNPLSDTTEIDPVMWENYARTFLHGGQLIALVESGQPVVKRDSVTYVPDMRDEPIPGSFKKTPKSIIQSMYAVVFDVASGKVVQKGFYPYQIEVVSPGR